MTTQIIEGISINTHGVFLHIAPSEGCTVGYTLIYQEDELRERARVADVNTPQQIDGDDVFLGPDAIRQLMGRRQPTS